MSPHWTRSVANQPLNKTRFLAVPFTSPSPTDCSALLTSIPVPLSKHHQYRPASRSTAANIIHIEAIPNSALHHLAFEILHDPYGIMKGLGYIPARVLLSPFDLKWSTGGREKAVPFHLVSPYIVREKQDQTFQSELRKCGARVLMFGAKGTCRLECQCR